MLAGAKSNLATDWPLSDTVAPHFMYNFYKFFVRGDTVVNALFNARTVLWDYDPEFETPVHWVACELFENPFKRINRD